MRLPGLLSADLVARLAVAVDTAPERDPGPNPLSLDTMRFASNLFYASGVLQRFLCSDPVLAVVTALIGPDAWVRWDQAVWKGPGAPVFPWHQDNGYTGLPVEHLQLWVALSPSYRDNGGLLVAPGGHRRAADHRWVGGHVEIDEPAATLAVDAEPGDVIAFSSWLPHSTGPNVTDTTRLAYVAEYLPLGERDPGVRAPHLVACRGGRAVGAFEDLPAG